MWVYVESSDSLQLLAAVDAVRDSAVSTNARDHVASVTAIPFVSFVHPDLAILVSV